MQQQDETCNLQMYTISLLLIAIRNSNLVIATAVTINSCHSGHSDFFIIEKANYNINHIIMHNAQQQENTVSAKQRGRE